MKVAKLKATKCECPSGQISGSMLMFAAGAMATAAPLRAAGRAWRSTGSGRRGEYGKTFGKLGGPAVRAFGPFPAARPDQDLAVLLAFLAMKFVNRHERRIAVHVRSNKTE